MQSTNADLVANIPRGCMTLGRVITDASRGFGSIWAEAAFKRGDRAALSGQGFRDRSQSQRWKKRQTADDHRACDQKADEQRSMRGHRSQGSGDDALGRQQAGNAQHRHDHREASHEHRRRQGQIEEGGIGIQPGEGAAIGRRA